MKKSIPVVLVMALLFAAALGACAPKGPSQEDIARFSYYNEDAGFGVAYPEGCTVLTSEEINDLMTLNIEIIRSMFDDPEEAEEALSRSIPVSYVFKYPPDSTEEFNPNLNIIVQEASRLYTADVTGFVSAVLEEAGEQGAPTAYGEVQAVKIGGKDAAVVDATQSSSGFTILQKQYFVPNKDRITIITVTGGTAEELNEMSRIVDTVEFFR